MDRLTTLPNVLTLSRLAAAPLLLVFAAYDAATPFLILLSGALLSDVVDGPIARTRGQASVRGATLDSWADCVLYFTAPFGVVLLDPWVLEQEVPTVAAVIAGYAVPIAAGAFKFGRLTSYHTVAARVSGSGLALAGIVLMATEATWPLRVAALLLALSAAEEIAITRALPRWRANVPSLRAALRIRASEG